MDIEREEERKLLSKYPNMNRPLGGAMGGRGGGRGGHSAFLQKRLAKGQKFFDSGDYQVREKPIFLKNRSTMMYLFRKDGECCTFLLYL